MRTVSAIAAFFAGLFLVISALAGTTTASDSLPPCQYEDSQHCYWDADTMGNGVGFDVVNR